MSDRRRPMPREQMLLGAFIGGLVLLGWSAFQLRDAVRLVRRGEHGSGTIARIETRHRSGRRGRRHSEQYAIIRLVGPRTTGQCERRARFGDAVGVSSAMVFLPEDPAVCGPDRITDLVGLPGLGFGVGALVVLGSLVAYERMRRSLRT